MLRPTTITLALAAVAAVALPRLADAQAFYRCVGKDGKKYYSATIPRPCIGQPIEELDSHGMVIRRIVQETPEQRAAKEAERKKEAEAAAAAQEERRRNRALLATYTSVKDIDDQESRALAGVQKELDSANERMKMIQARKAKIERETAKYKGQPLPPQLKSDAANIEVEVSAQNDLIEAKKKAAEAVKTKYAEDRKRFIELTKGN